MFKFNEHLGFLLTGSLACVTNKNFESINMQACGTADELGKIKFNTKLSCNCPCSAMLRILTEIR